MADEASDSAWAGAEGACAQRSADPDQRLRRAEQLADFACALAGCRPEARAIAEVAAQRARSYLGVPCGVAQVRDGLIRLHAVATPDAATANALHAAVVRRPLATHGPREMGAAGPAAGVRLISAAGAGPEGAALVLPLGAAGAAMDAEAHAFAERLADQVAAALANARRFAHVRAQNEALAGQARALTEAVGQLEGFTWSAAHDLRAPLRTIEGLTSELVDEYAEGLPPDGRELLDHVYRNVERMAELVDDLLVLSQVTRRPLRRAWVDLPGLVAAVVQDLDGPPTRTRTVRCTASMRVWADPGLLRILLGNLLGNALKYSSRRPDPRVEVGAEGPQRFFVRDNGAGFDPARAELLFEPFQRLHDRRDFPGTGIGLTTCARIVRRHGGSIRGEGQPDAGAVFHVDLGSAPPAEIS
ncbi:MAG: hypothetical protein H6704_29235 [Myxococcales bacterium]|nr:hypothetical protein [Myxococcales bacterium]